MNKRIIILSSLALLLAFCTPQKKHEHKLIDVKTFFKNPERSKYKISPSGNYISFLKPYKNRKNIFVRSTEKDSAQRISDATLRDINFYTWIDDDNLIYAYDSTGEENYHLIVVSRDGKTKKDITPFEKTRAIFIEKDKSEENSILVAMNLRDKSIFDIYKMNLITGKYKLVQKNPGNVSTWVLDHDGVVRVALQPQGVIQKILYRSDKSSNFTQLIQTDFKNEFMPINFSDDNKFIYAISNIDRDKSALVKFDPEKRIEVEEIFSHPEVDISDAIFSKKNNELIGVRYTTWKIKYKFFDKKWIEIDKLIKSKLGNDSYSIASRDTSETKILIRSYSDKSMGAYYLLDTQGKTFNKIADISPWLKPEYMAKVENIRFKSRDSLLINGYLTLPPGKEPKNLPVVVYIHGGPWTRSKWGFDYISQFLANRGYAVLDVNYRGSTGYGKKFFQAGFKEWGGKMLDDVNDGTKWLLEQGIADPKRIAVFGFSFGGYSALMALAKNPELYACGIDYSGIVSVERLFESIPSYYTPFLEMMYEMIGNPKTESGMLKNISPLYLADKIKKPLMVIHGKKDNRVKFEDVVKFVSKLKKNGTQVEFLVKNDEGHSFMNEENRIELFRKLEMFLDKHLAQPKFN